MRTFSDNIRTSSEDFLIEACANKQKTGVNMLTKEEIRH